jgi:hypothetical protein
MVPLFMSPGETPLGAIRALGRERLLSSSLRRACLPRVKGPSGGQRWSGLNRVEAEARSRRSLLASLAAVASKSRKVEVTMHKITTKPRYEGNPALWEIAERSGCVY